MKGVNGKDNVFVLRVSVSVHAQCVCLPWLLDAIDPKRLQMRTSNLTCMFLGTVPTRPLKNLRIS